MTFDHVIVDKPILGVRYFKVKSGYKIPMTPYNKYVLSIIPKGALKYIYGNYDTVMKEINAELGDWALKVQQASIIKQTQYPELVVNEHLVLSDYQNMALEFIRTLDRCLLLMEQGTGKTLVTLTRLSELLTSTTILVVCPKHVRIEWRIMIEDFFPDMVYKIIDDNQSFVPEPNIVYITHYDRLRLMPMIKFDTVIFDEIHKLKNGTGVTNGTAYKFVQPSTRIIGLTGTPYGTHLLDVFGITKIVDERLYGTTEGYFTGKYVLERSERTADGMVYPVTIGHQNMDEFTAKFNSISLRIPKSVLNLKAAYDMIRFIEKPAQYNILQRDLILRFDNAVSVVQNILNITAKLQQICSGFTNTDDGWKRINSIKLDSMMEYLEDIQEQVVICVLYDESELMIEEALKRKKYTYNYLSGRTKHPDDVKLDFKAQKFQYLIVKYSSSSAGANFQNCRLMVMYDLTPSWIDYDQMKSRIHRRGQEHECTYIHMITEKSVEGKILKALQQRKSFAEYIMEGNSIWT